MQASGAATKEDSGVKRDDKNDGTNVASIAAPDGTRDTKKEKRRDV